MSAPLNISHEYWIVVFRCSSNFFAYDNATLCMSMRLEKILGLAPKNDPRDDMMEYFLDVKADPIG